MTLFQIEAELRSLASELRGHDDIDQWLWLEKLADDLEQQRRYIMRRSNRLAARALPWYGMDSISDRWYA